MSPQQRSVSPQSVAQLDAQANVESVTVPKKTTLVSLEREIHDDHKAAEQKVVSGSMSERVSQAKDRLMKKLHILDELLIKFSEVLEKHETVRGSLTCIHSTQNYVLEMAKTAAISSSKVNFDGIGVEDGLPSLVDLQNKVQNDCADFVAEARHYYKVLGDCKFWLQQFSYFDPPYVSDSYVPKVLGPSAIKPTTTMIRHRKRKLQNASQMKFVSECIKRDPRSAELWDSLIDKHGY